MNLADTRFIFYLLQFSGNRFILMNRIPEMQTNSPFLNLFILAIPIACISWTVTHEELFREPRIYFVRRSMRDKWIVTRKFFYMLTCEYCFSHYITIAFLIITKYRLLFDDWKGYLIAGFSLVWVANIYMSLYGKIRLGIKKEKIELDEIKQAVDQNKELDKKTDTKILKDRILERT